jgi:hypothetical protein
MLLSPVFAALLQLCCSSVAKLQQSCNRAATELVAGPGAETATELQQSCNRAATELVAGPGAEVPIQRRFKAVSKAHALHAAALLQLCCSCAVVHALQQSCYVAALLQAYVAGICCRHMLQLCCSSVAGAVAHALQQSCYVAAMLQLCCSSVAGICFRHMLQLCGSTVAGAVAHALQAAASRLTRRLCSREVAYGSYCNRAATYTAATATELQYIKQRWHTYACCYCNRAATELQQSLCRRLTRARSRRRALAEVACSYLPRGQMWTADTQFTFYQ